MSAALAERLRPVQDALAGLEREYRERASTSGEPDAWASWADLWAALMAVRAAQGRDARRRSYRVGSAP